MKVIEHTKMYLARQTIEIERIQNFDCQIEHSLFRSKKLLATDVISSVRVLVQSDVLLKKIVRFLFN